MEVFKMIDERAAEIAAAKALHEARTNSVLSPWGKRRLKRFKTVNGKRYQLHATRGWKAA